MYKNKTERGRKEGGGGGCIKTRQRRRKEGGGMYKNKTPGERAE